MVALEDTRTHEASHAVVYGVPGHRRHDQQHKQQGHTQHRALQGGQCPHGKQQRITRQEGRHHQACLAEQHAKQHQVQPGTQRGRPVIQVGVEVQKQIDQIGWVHGAIVVSPSSRSTPTSGLALQFRHQPHGERYHRGPVFRGVVAAIVAGGLVIGRAAQAVHDLAGQHGRRGVEFRAVHELPRVVVADPHDRAGGHRGFTPRIQSNCLWARACSCGSSSTLAAFASPTPAEARLALMPTHQSRGGMK